MYLTLTSTAPDATGLGYLLHKHPARAQQFDVSAGVAHVLYPEATDERCTVALLLEVDPVALVRGRRYGGDTFALSHYVNDRPYAASSMLAVAPLCLDTGCVFGGRLSALRYPEKYTVQVPAERVWYEPVKPFPTSRDTPAPGQRDRDQLDVTDVLGKRVVETAHHGLVTVKEENVAGALEVMSRFALHPRWLPYLPPTMAPPATSKRADVLEHPDEALSAYGSVGVGELVCEEKHMGSRAVLVVCRDAEAAATRFGATGDESGAAYTRTGRSFFDRDTTEQLLAGIRTAVTSTGLWEELETDWLLLDAEILPWSAKAGDLLRDQYAAVGAAARHVLPAAVTGLRAALARGVDVGDLLARTSVRAGNAEAFTEAYRRYCWPSEGLEGVAVAPFQVLATQGRTYHRRDHLWHLDVADRLVLAAPDVVRATRRLQIDLSDPASVTAAVDWWESLTAAGGEGMVVKPVANLTHTRRGLAQPGVKVRCREYLRIIYGPDYTEPANLARLRERNLGHKRSLALREYALGLESLERLSRGDPLWRVHEAVFAVLALESEPVDPRLSVRGDGHRPSSRSFRDGPGAQNVHGECPRR